MSEKRRRSQNFTADEKVKLIKILTTFKESILNMRTDGTTNEAKANAWIEATARFNSSGTNHRTKVSLMRVWEKLKTEAKLYNKNIKVGNNKTGGAPSIVKIDPVIKEVCRLMGRGCTGIMCVDGSDEDTSIIIEEISHPLLTDHSNNQHEIYNLKVVEPPVVSDNNSIEISNESHADNQYRTPIWSRRCKPTIDNRNERTEAATSLYNKINKSYEEENNKRMSTEEVKYQLLIEELEFKRKLYQLQLESASKEAEIKTEILKQIKEHWQWSLRVSDDGNTALQYLYGPQQK